MTNQVSSDKPYPVPQREKYWEECSVEEKLDRVREMLLALNADNGQMSQGIVELLRHTHHESGAILTPIKNPGANDCVGYARDRSYRLKTERERENAGRLGW